MKNVLQQILGDVKLLTIKLGYAKNVVIIFI